MLMVRGFLGVVALLLLAVQPECASALRLRVGGLPTIKESTGRDDESVFSDSSAESVYEDAEEMHFEESSPSNS